MAHLYVDGRKPALDLCKAFGLDPDQVRKLVLTFEADAVATVDVEFYPDGAEVTEAVELLKSYSLTEKPARPEPIALTAEDHRALVASGSRVSGCTAPWNEAAIMEEDLQFARMKVMSKEETARLEREINEKFRRGDVSRVTEAGGLTITDTMVGLSDTTEFAFLEATKPDPPPLTDAERAAVEAMEKGAFW